MRNRIAAVLVSGGLMLASGIAQTKPQVACASLEGQKIAASAIGLPTTGATITSAAVVAATEQTITGNRAVLAIPEYCKIVGSISPVDPTAPLINFQVNLPTAWNRKTIQLGGSGVNGVIPAAVTNAPQFGPESLPPDSPYAISRGFVTYGSDSGHQTPPPGPGGRGAGGLPADNSWAANHEASVNLAYAQMKKTHDVEVWLLRAYYGQAARHSYYMGSSQGGREALVVAQRFPQDYDGVFTQVPILPYAHLMMDGMFRTRAQMGDGWIPPAKIAAIAKEVRRVCDEFDGIKDGLVSNYVACNNRFDPGVTPGSFSAIRCEGGKDTGDDCLSDAQVEAARRVYASVKYPFPLYKGWTEFPGWTTGSESANNWKGLASRPDPAGGLNPMLKITLGKPEFNAQSDLAQYREAIQEMSALYDGTDPDLSAFYKRGGKLIMKVNTTDYTANPRWSYAYHDRVVETMGKKTTDEFLRLYVAVGLFHGRNVGRNPVTNESVPGFIDFITMLDNWVEQGKAPADRQVLVDMKPVPPFDVVSSLPLCRYPQYPRFKGEGDPKKADSYTCSMP